MKLRFIFIVAVNLSISLFGQSLFIENGQYGVLGSASYAYSEDVYSIGGRIGYSPDSDLNFTVSVSRSFYETHDLKSTSLGGSISYLLFKPQKDIPFFIHTHCGMQYGAYDGSELPENNTSVTNFDYFLGANLIFKVKFLGVFDIYPGFGATHIWRELRVKTENFSNTSSDTVVSYKTGIDFSIPFSEVSRLILSPGVSFTDSHNSYSIAVGFLLLD